MWFKFQGEIPSRSAVCVYGDYGTYTPPSPPLTEEEKLRDIAHSINIEKLILGVSSVTVSYLIHYYYKMQQIF